jgi:hypothetical protein
MESNWIITVARLREMAERCRQLVAQAHFYGTAAELESLARDYDGDAARLEASDVGGVRSGAMQGDIEHQIGEQCAD